MSMKFNDTTNKNGIIQQIESNCKFDDGGISGNTTRLKKFTADVNLAWDFVLSIIFGVGGKWQFDDSNHEEYPIVEADLVANQKDYTFTTDEQGNLILEIFKVFVKDRNGIYYEVLPKDMQSDTMTEEFWDGNDVAGIPLYYDKTANGIILNVPPSYSWRIGTELERGIKIFINREASYFVYTDTTKKPGFAGIFHEFLSLRPSYQYAYRNGLSNKNDLKNEMLEMEVKMRKHYRDRSKDDELELTGQQINSI